MSERPEQARDWPFQESASQVRPTEDTALEPPDFLTAEPEPELELPRYPTSEVLLPDPVVEPAPAVEEEPPSLSEAIQEHAPGGFRVPDGYSVLQGQSEGDRRSVGIVVSRFNAEITNRLLQSALDELMFSGVSKDAIVVMPVPGAFELPIAAMALAKTRRHACVIALGCVIRGETPHFDFVAAEAASGLQLAAIDTGVPISFGLLTLNSADQAEARISKGAEAARTALEMADLFAQLRANAAAAR